MKRLKNLWLILLLVDVLCMNNAWAQVPVQVSPLNNSVNVAYSVDLVWHKVAGTSGYAVEYSKNSNMSGGVSTSGLTDTTFTLNGLMANTTWYWRVMAVVDGTGEWSGIWQFTTRNVELPVQVMPENNATGQPYDLLTLNWSEAAGAVEYSVQYSLNSDMSSSTSVGGITEPSFDLDNLLPNTDYYWQVGATAYGAFSGWSPIWKFRTKCSCSSFVKNDTVTFFVSDMDYSPVSSHVYLHSIDSLKTIVGQCDSVLNHMHEFVFEANHYTDTITVTDTLIIDVTFTGGTSPNNLHRIKVYPNPANDVVYIHTGDAYGELSNYRIKIINSLQQVVFDQLVNEQLFAIDVDDFAKTGLYFIQIINDAGVIVDVRKIILK